MTRPHTATYGQSSIANEQHNMGVGSMTGSPLSVADRDIPPLPPTYIPVGANPHCAIMRSSSPNCSCLVVHGMAPGGWLKFLLSNR